MTPLQKQYIEKLEELIYQLNKQPNNIGKEWRERVEILELELASLKQQIEAEEKTVSDEEIESHFKTQHYDNKNGHHYRINKDRIFGAKWMRDKLLNNQDNGC